MSRVGPHDVLARACGVEPGSMISGEEWARREALAREQWASNRAQPVVAPAIAWEHTHHNQRAAEVSGGRLLLTRFELRAVWRLHAWAGGNESAGLVCELTREPTDAECIAWLAVATLHASRIPNAKAAVFGERA